MRHSPLIIGIHLTDVSVCTGILVALLILLSSVRIFKGAILELTDASISPNTLQTYQTILSSNQPKEITRLDSIRAIRSGSSVFVDLDITLRNKDRLSAIEALEAMDTLKKTLCEARKEVKEVRISFRIE